MNEKAKQWMVKGRVQILLTEPFFATLLLRMNLVEAEWMPTMGVDGRSLFFNPEFALSLSMDHLRAVLCHEAMHVAMLHPLRLQHRDRYRANIAMDAVINPIVKDGKLSLPDDCVDLPWAKGKTWEWVYEQLPNMMQQGGSVKGKGQGQAGASGSGQPQQGQGNGKCPPTPGGFGQVLDSPAKGQAERAAEEREWRIAVQEAAQAAKAAGRLPASLERFAKELRAPKMDWRDLLRRFIEETIISDYTWARPNRRYVSQGIYLPGALKEGCGEIVVAIDTSGSIDDKTLNQFAAELREIHGEVKPSQVHVVYCDAKVQRVDSYGPGDTVEIKPMGGGGTDFRPVFDWIGKQEVQPKCLVYLTDLYGQHSDAAPEYPVLWTCISNEVAPFGETLQLEID